MSRPSSMVQRPLTLTEELEKLEQSITLTLQEIDQNFSQAHRIVTTSILPLVEQYAENSRDVWEGAKFWKQFFEASANVSLSGYEEKPNEDTTVQEEEPTATEEADVTQSNETETVSGAYDNPDEQDPDADVTRNKADDLDLTSLTLPHSTPRAPAPEKSADADTTTASSIEYSSTSPYENLKKQINESQSPFDMDDSNLPSTPPGKSASTFRQYRGSSPMSPSSSPFVPPISHENPSATSRGHSSKPSDPVMHRMPDKTYRVQATPLGKGYSAAGGGAGGGNGRSKFTVTPKAKPTSKYTYDDSPLSSPEPEAPQLHEEVFSSPIKGNYNTPGTDRKRRFAPPSTSHLHTPQPGTSVLTPAKGSAAAGKRPAWDSDDDDDDGLGGADFGDDGFSPPKTMQFHIPQSRLMKTPAKEASKRIVEDLLVTAGAEDITDSVGEQSPSLIRRAQGLEDETL